MNSSLCLVVVQVIAAHTSCSLQGIRGPSTLRHDPEYEDNMMDGIAATVAESDESREVGGS